jgi:ABC-type multidrug transport system fused ATPase/permease subunit
MIPGSIRFNLDPFGLHSDEEIWQALRRCQMEANVQRVWSQFISNVLKIHFEDILLIIISVHFLAQANIVKL